MKLLNIQFLPIFFRIFVSCIAPLLVSPSLVTAENKARVMSLGDSLCQGNASALRNKINAERFGARIEWVGSKFNGTSFAPRTECHSGWTAAQVWGGDGTPLPVWETQNPGRARDWVREANPDVVLLMLGTNDYFAGAPFSVLTQSLEGILNEIYSFNPQASVVLASVPPIAGDFKRNKGENETIESMSRSISKLALRKSREGKSMYFVDMYRIVKGAALSKGHASLWDENDEVHFNHGGNKILADAWSEILKNVLQARGATPQEPSVGPRQPQTACHVDTITLMLLKRVQDRIRRSTMLLTTSTTRGEMNPSTKNLRRTLAPQQSELKDSTKQLSRLIKATLNIVKRSQRMRTLKLQGLSAQLEFLEQFQSELIKQLCSIAPVPK
jgi:GDSL-like Lipase/Acylhydrolase family